MVPWLGHRPCKVQQVSLLALSSLGSVFLPLAHASGSRRSSSSKSDMLPMLEPVAIGHSRLLDLGHGDGRAGTKVRTLAMSPPIFYVEGFLTQSEADAIVKKANGSRMFESGVGVTQNENRDKDNDFKLSYASGAFKSYFNEFDQNDDGRLEAAELQHFLQHVFDMPNHDHSIFMKKYNLTTEAVSFQDFKDKRINLGKYARWVVKHYPHLKARHSLQKWLPYESTETEQLVPRARRLTQLTESIESEELQVLRYPRLGHYSCHHDSSPDSIEEGYARLATLALFLNEPTGGGEIAFPGADHAGVAEGWDEEQWASLEAQCQPTKACTAIGGLVQRPKKGDAVLWYNLRANRWRADGNGEWPNASVLYWNSMHCGAEVKSGEKWMANLWLRTPDAWFRRKHHRHDEL